MQGKLNYQGTLVYDDTFPITQQGYVHHGKYSHAPGEIGMCRNFPFNI